MTKLQLAAMAEIQQRHNTTAIEWESYPTGVIAWCGGKQYRVSRRGKIEEISEPLFYFLRIVTTADERALLLDARWVNVAPMTVRECKQFASAQVAEKFSKKANRRVYYEARPCNGNSQPIRFNPSCYRDLGR